MVFSMGGHVTINHAPKCTLVTFDLLTYIMKNAKEVKGSSWSGGRASISTDERIVAKGSFVGVAIGLRLGALVLGTNCILPGRGWGLVLGTHSIVSSEKGAALLEDYSLGRP